MLVQCCPAPQTPLGKSHHAKQLQHSVKRAELGQDISNAELLSCWVLSARQWHCICNIVAQRITRCCAHTGLQALYNAVPYALSPILGNPLALAAVNVDRKASLATQVCFAAALLGLPLCSAAALLGRTDMFCCKPHCCFACCCSVCCLTASWTTTTICLSAWFTYTLRGIMHRHGICKVLLQHHVHDYMSCVRRIGNLLNSLECCSKRKM